MRTYRAGSNQFRKRLTPLQYTKALGFVGVWTIAFLYCFRVGVQDVVIPATTQWAKKTFDVVAYAPTASKAYADTYTAGSAKIITPTPSISPIHTEIEQVFGSDSPKAFKLLSCENSSLNPDAVNTAGNYPAGSRDIGVFQINEYWQKVNAKFLFNSDINIRMAYQLYKENGNSFRLWTCGRKFGI